MPIMWLFANSVSSMNFLTRFVLMLFYSSEIRNVIYPPRLLVHVSLRKAVCTAWISLLFVLCAMHAKATWLKVLPSSNTSPREGLPIVSQSPASESPLHQKNFLLGLENVKKQSPRKFKTLCLVSVPLNTSWFFPLVVSDVLRNLVMAFLRVVPLS